MPQISLLPMSLSSVVCLLVFPVLFTYRGSLKIVPLLKILCNPLDFDLFIFLLFAMLLSLTVF